MNFWSHSSSRGLLYPDGLPRQDYPISSWRNEKLPPVQLRLTFVLQVPGTLAFVLRDSRLYRLSQSGGFCRHLHLSLPFKADDITYRDAIGPIHKNAYPNNAHDRQKCFSKLVCACLLIFCAPKCLVLILNIFLLVLNNFPKFSNILWDFYVFFRN